MKTGTFTYEKKKILKLEFLVHIGGRERERERERGGGGVLDWCLVLLVRWVDVG